MKLKIAKIVGPSVERSWSQVHTFVPGEKEKLEARGEFLAVMSLGELTREVEIASAGRELISRLHEEYYGSLEEKPFAQLKKAVEKVVKEASLEAKIEINAACVVGDVLYLAIAGGGKAVLQRQGKTTTILQGSYQPFLVETASGYLQNGDIFLLGTKSFFEVVPEGVIQAALASGSAQEVVESLSPVVLGKEEGLAAAAIAGVEEETVPVIKEREARKTEIVLQAISKIFSRMKQKITEKPEEKPKRSLFTVALILFLILGVSMVFGAKERKRRAEKKQIEEILQQVRARKEEGEAILSLNPAKGREILKEAEGILESLEERKISSAELEEAKKELENSLTSALKEYELEAKLFFDLEMIKKGAVGRDFVASGGQLVVLDSQNLAVYSLGATEKKQAILAGGSQIEGASQLAAFWPKVFILGKEGIYQASGGNFSLVVKKDKDWQEAVDLGTFAGNLYLLDKKMIWVYPAGEAGFGNKKAWLKNPADFSEALGMAIDGAIWVLKKDGSIEKYLRGEKDAFGIAGMDKDFSEPAALYTSPEEEHLYILDKGNSRIVVLNKNGEYYSQYKSPQISDAQSLVAWEKEGKIFLLNGSKIYQIELQ